MSGDALLRRIPRRIQVHVPGGPLGGGLAIVDRPHPPVGEPDDHEAAAADIAGLGVDHRQRESHGDGGVHRVSAPLQHVDAHLTRDWAAGDHHRLRAGHGTNLGEERPLGGEVLADAGRPRRSRMAGGQEQDMATDDGEWWPLRMIHDFLVDPRGCCGEIKPSATHEPHGHSGISRPPSH